MLVRLAEVLIHLIGAHRADEGGHHGVLADACQDARIFLCGLLVQIGQLLRRHIVGVNVAIAATEFVQELLADRVALLLRQFTGKARKAPVF
jgi:hypothetical protein